MKEKLNDLKSYNLYTFARMLSNAYSLTTVNYVLVSIFVLIIRDSAYRNDHFTCPGDHSSFPLIRLSISWMNGSSKCFDEDARQPNIDIFLIYNVRCGWSKRYPTTSF